MNTENFDFACLQPLLQQAKERIANSNERVSLNGTELFALQAELLHTLVDTISSLSSLQLQQGEAVLNVRKSVARMEALLFSDEPIDEDIRLHERTIQ